MRLPRPIGRDGISLRVEDGLTDVEGVEESTVVDCNSGVGARGNANGSAEVIGDLIDAGMEMNGYHSRVGIWG